MKLFQMEVHRTRDGRVLLCHFPTQEDALAHVKKKFYGWEIRNLVEITQAAYFQIADKA
jgi:hypothetical protein